MLNTLKNKGNGSPTHDFPPVMTEISGTARQERCGQPLFPVPAILESVNGTRRVCVTANQEQPLCGTFSEWTGALWLNVQN